MRNGNLLRRMLLTIFVISNTTMIVFADASNIGQNFGEWGLSQLWWVALVIVGGMAVRFLLKKAWVPCAAFCVIAALLLVIINSPDKLMTIGNSFWNILFQ